MVSSTETSSSIIAIHGLDTHSEQTFRTYEEEGDKTSRLVHWLRDEDMLPSRFPFARIYTYDWNAATISEASSQYFHHHAQDLLRAVSREQQKHRNCPIIFIGSCYGGLILAKALCLASQAERYERETLDSTQGVIFLGTPFRGSSAASAAHIRVLIAEVMGANVSPELVKMQETETGSLAEVRAKFCSIAHQRWESSCRVACFFETRPTRFLKMVRFLPEMITSRKKIVVRISSPVRSETLNNSCSWLTANPPLWMVGPRLVFMSPTRVCQNSVAQKMQTTSK